MTDLIDRQTAIDAHYEYCNKHSNASFPVWSLKILKDLPSAQPETHDKRTETHACDLISRQAAIDLFPNDDLESDTKGGYIAPHLARQMISELPFAQPTLYGYNIEHLELIARVLQKEDLPPERVVEVLTDVGRIVAIVKDEFEETLRKAVEQCMT